jgi:hypothetical protein
VVGEGHCYLDASAVVKLVVAEPETAALRAFLAQQRSFVSSRLTAVEVARALARAGMGVDVALERILSRIHQVAISDQILSTAAGLNPASLRTLDAIHLATAMAAGSDIAVLVSYDRRLTEAAAAAGIPTASPQD